MPFSLGVSLNYCTRIHVLDDTKCGQWCFSVEHGHFHDIVSLVHGILKLGDVLRIQWCLFIEHCHFHDIIALVLGILKLGDASRIGWSVFLVHAWSVESSNTFILIKICLTTLLIIHA